MPVSTERRHMGIMKRRYKLALHAFKAAPCSISSTSWSKVLPRCPQAFGTSDVSVMPGDVLMSMTWGRSLIHNHVDSRASGEVKLPPYGERFITRRFPRYPGSAQPARGTPSCLSYTWRYSRRQPDFGLTSTMGRARPFTTATVISLPFDVLLDEQLAVVAKGSFHRRLLSPARAARSICRRSILLWPALRRRAAGIALPFRICI